MSRLGMEDDQPLESKMVTRAIEQSQQRVESYHFDIRKNVVKYDDVMNAHRDVIYTERDKVLEGDDIRDTVMDMLENEVESLANQHLRETPPDPEAFRLAIDLIVPDLGSDELRVDDFRGADQWQEEAIALLDHRYLELEEEVGGEVQRLVERLVLLRTIDSLWVEHVTAMDEMRQGIALRAYGQADPLVAYKREAHDMWSQFRDRIRETFTRQILRARVAFQAAVQAIQQEQAPTAVRTSGPGDDEGNGNGAVPVAAGSAPAAVAEPPPDSAPRAERRRYERQVQKAQKRKTKRTR
jgi:preprotein translocase subunit SecA